MRYSQLRQGDFYLFLDKKIKTAYFVISTPVPKTENDRNVFWKELVIHKRKIEDCYTHQNDEIQRMVVIRDGKLINI